MKRRLINRRAALALALSGAVTIGVFVWVRPLEAPPPLDPAAAWIASVQKLGVTPVYPPREDMQVGDVMAVIEPTPPGSGAPRTVRLARLDLREEIRADQRLELRFARTPPVGTGASFRELSPWSEPLEHGSDKIALSLAAFPGFTVQGTRKVNASGGLGWNVTGARDDREEEELRMPVAETYSVPAFDALRRLGEFCLAAAPQVRPEGVRPTLNPCDESHARSVLSYAYGTRALERYPDGTVPKVRIVVVIRVYLMREIRQSSTRGSQRNMSTALPATPVAEASDGAGSASIASTHSAGIALDQVFQRPLVFGYVGVSFDPP